MSIRRDAMILVFGLLFLSIPASVAGGTSRIAKPMPVLNAPPKLAPLPPAVFDPNLAISGKDVKAREIDTRLSVDVEVNGRGPYHFIVDSGADTSAVSLRVANALALPLGTPVILNGMTDREVVDRVKVAQLTVGATTIRNLQVPALRETDLGGDGLIGIDALVEQRLLMDFEKHLIKVEDASTPVEILPGEIVITAKRKRGQLILSEVRAAHFRLDAVIDTGSEITIGNTALRDKLIRKNRARFWEVDAIGVTGVKTKLQLALIDQLQLGPVTFRDVPIAFADVPPFKLFGLSDGPALLLGTDLLANFRRVSLDFAARKIRFQLRHCATEGVTISTAPIDMFTRMSASAPETCVR